MFADEKPKPPLSNLAAHTNNAHKDDVRYLKTQAGSTESEGTSSAGHGYSAASANFLSEYLKEGLLNPAIELTVAGFNKLFAAWIFEQDLPFTTGEAPSLQNLFRYLKIKYILPSDTTVRNILCKIFTELRAQLVRDLTVV